MTDRKPRPLLIAVIIGLPVLYVSSFGPAYWLGKLAIIRGFGRETVMGCLNLVYAPIFWLITDGPKPISDALCWYAQML